MSNYLYTNSRGFKVTRHSYSAGQDWRRSPYLYYLKRVLGWREKGDRAAFRFGEAVEAGVRFHHENGGAGGPEAFTSFWAKFKDAPLLYTDREGSWAELDRDGRDMLRLYAIRQPVPLQPPVRFQAEVRKEVFPRSNLSGIDFVGYLDMLVPREGGFLILDCKTGASEPPQHVEWDDQLRTYSWATGFRDVGFLWFTKATTGGFKRGQRVTTLVSRSGIAAAVEMVVLDSSQDGRVGVIAPEIYETIAPEFKGKKGEKQISALVEKWSADATYYDEADVTKQGLSIVTGTVSEDSAREAGEIVGQQIAEIVMHREKNWWPREGFGVRFPNNWSNDPWFKAFILNDASFRDENFVQIGDGEW